MEVMYGGVMAFCLPDSAHCKADDGHRTPLAMGSCPLGNEECSGDCSYYSEEPFRPVAQ